MLCNSFKNLSLPQDHDDVLLSLVSKGLPDIKQSLAAQKAASGLYSDPPTHFQPSCTNGSLWRLQKSLGGHGSFQITQLGQWVISAATIRGQGGRPWLTV